MRLALHRRAIRVIWDDDAMHDVAVGMPVGIPVAAGIGKVMPGQCGLTTNFQVGPSVNSSKVQAMEGSPAGKCLWYECVDLYTVY